MYSEQKGLYVIKQSKINIKQQWAINVFYSDWQDIA